MVKKEAVIEVLNALKKSTYRKSMLGAKQFSETKFQILISTILSARAKDTTTIPVSRELFKKYPDAKTLANVRQKGVERIICRIGFYRNKAKNIINTAKIINKEFWGRVPASKQELLSLPGVGPKVANCVLVYAFNKPCIPVDTHVHKVANRLGWVRTKATEQTEKALERIVPKKYWPRVNELFVLHGQDVCKRIPLCSECGIFKYCRRINVVKRR